MVTEDGPPMRATDTGFARLVYMSQATPGLEDADLQGILATARERNPARGVTGLLLYSNGVFFQLLEGPEPILIRLVGSIAGDPRNHSLEMLAIDRDVERLFDGWAMAYLPLDSPAGGRIRATAGLNTLDDLRALIERGRQPFDVFLNAILEEMVATEAEGSTRI